MGDQDGCPDSPEVVTWLNKRKVVFWVGDGSEYADKPVYPDYDAVIKAGYKVGSARFGNSRSNPSAPAPRARTPARTTPLRNFCTLSPPRATRRHFQRCWGPVRRPRPI